MYLFGITAVKKMQLKKKIIYATHMEVKSASQVIKHDQNQSYLSFTSKGLK